MNVRIPSGVTDGQRIRLKGKGQPGRRNGPAGDLYVVVHVRKHSLFGRTGDDLTLTIPVTFPEAALGTSVRVPTLDGALTLRVPAGTPSGRTLRVRGRGVPRKDGTTGDLLATIEVVVPTHLDDAAKAALEAYAEATPGDPRANLKREAERRG
jgi:molecular chaperone DnaJ